MRTSPDLDSDRSCRNAGISEIEGLGDQLVALFEEFEAELSEGRVPSAFAERLAELRQSAEPSVPE